jgi:hypothetical protein
MFGKVLEEKFGENMYVGISKYEQVAASII